MKIPESFLDQINLGVAFEVREALLRLVISSKNENLNFETSGNNSSLLNDFFKTSEAVFFVYDLKAFSKELSVLGINLPAKIYDILLGCYVKNSNDKNDFESIVESELEIDFTERSEGNDLNFEQTTNTFLLQKAKFSLQLGEKYLQEIKEPQLNLWKNIESPLAPILGQMEAVGVYIDNQKLKEISLELKTKSLEYEGKILEKLNDPSLNINSTKQLPESLIKAGFDLKKASSKGKISTDKETLDNLKKDDPTGVISDILQYRTVSKLFSTFTESFLSQLDTNSRIHGIYSQAQVPTGRLSSNSPNLQNIPIKNPIYGPMIRSTFSSPEGFILVGADYSQFELRLLAHFSKDPVLLETFELNQDTHARTAAEIFEVPIEQVTLSQRRVGKTLNFALIYQQGPYATSIQLGIEQKEAKSYIEKYFTRFSKVKPYIEETIENARKNGYVQTLYGRRRYFKNLNSKMAIIRKADERAAFNALLQGSNADIIKIAMVNIHRRLEKESLPAKIILQVHDELVLECGQKYADTVKEILITEMQINQPLLVPIEVNAGSGKNWNLLK